MPTSSSHSKKNQNQPSNQNEKILWLAVSASVFIILIVLGWSFKLQFDSLNWNATKEKELLDKSNYAWKKATLASQSSTDLESALDKADVQDAIQGIVSKTNDQNNTFVSSTKTNTNSTTTNSGVTTTKK
jgi:hypothetical protein